MVAVLLACSTVQAQSDPTPAQNLRAEVLPGGGIVLSWDAPAEDAGSITGYEILRRRPDRGENTLLSYVGDTRSNAITYTDLDAREPGEQYVYRVVALRGSSRSGRSNFARLVMPELVPVEPDPASLAPSNLAVRVAADGAALSWDAPAAGAATVTGYRVLRSVGASAMTILVEDTGSDDTTYTDASATTPGETYAYMVQALRGAETSQGSNTVSVSAPQAPDVPRSAASRVADATAPGNLTVTIVADGIALSWDAPTEGAHLLRGYQILRSRAGAPFTIRKATTHSRGTSYVDSWADWPGMTYTYQVKALRGRNVSEGSNQASLTRPACDGGSFNVTPEDVPVTAVPIVVTSTTQDYFVLFVRPILETDLEVPISVTLGESGSTTLQDRLEPLPAAHYRIEKYPVNDPADVDGDCTSDIDELNDLGTKNPLNRATPIVRHNGTVAIPDRETFERLSYQGTDLLSDTHLIELEFVKFFIYDERADRAGVYFMNTNTHRSHNSFFRVVEFPFRHSMRGVLVFHPNVIAPDGSLGVYRFEFEPWDTYSFTDVHHAYELLAASMPLLENNLSYYPVPEVLPLYYEEQLQYDASRVSLLFDNDIFPDVSFVQLNQGVGFGLLRSLSLEERPNPRDIVIYESLPNDLPRVAGIITTVPQTPLSHVNLRALQDRAPNAFIRDALDDDTIDSLIGSLVRYTVLRDSYTIRAASKSELDAHYEASRPAAAQAPVRDLTVTAITALSGVAFGDWDAFGVKAANVAVLGTLGFADGTVPDGFAVPFYFYDEFMKANELDAMVTTMLADADFQASYDTQEKELKKMRRAIKDATTPAWIITALEAMHAEFPDGTSLRYRSSTNNEDLPGFSGAGLYDSKTQDPDETVEDGIDKSIKGVWASLWNFRAFVERDFNRIDHSATAMGVLVHPNYSDELANGVAVSYDPPTNRTGAYYVNTQVGEDLVTNPEALSAPEQLLLLSDGSYEVIVRSNQVESNELLMTDAQIAQLRGHLATIHSSFKTLYAPAAGERFAMEIEFKITSDNVLAIKQARPWVFRPLNEPAAFPNTETGERTIAEGTPSNVAIGDPVAATDPDDDALTYTLSGADADWFRVDSSSGQLLTEKPLDFETQDRHEVDITVGDPFNAATTTIMVTINVTDVDEPADITFTEGSNVTANGNALTVDENYAGSLATFRADDPESTPSLTYQWSVVGTDGGDFAFTAEADTRSGELSFAANPDYERPADSVGNNVYDITVNARDSDNKTGRINVTVTVLPVNEPPIISGATEVNLNEVVDPTTGQVVRVDTYTKSDPDRRPPQTTNWGPVGSSQVLSGADRDTFEFDQLTGMLTFASPPDYENGGGRYRVTLTANDGADPGTLDVTVNVANVEEQGELTFEGGVTQGTNGVPLQATLTDPDGVATQTWVWQRRTGTSGPWTDIANADSNSYTPGADDVGEYLRARVTYTDGAGTNDTTLTKATELPTLNDASSNQPPTPPDPLPQVADVPEDAPAGRNVVQVVFTDPEGEQQLTYSLSGSDEFAIGSGSGRITVKSGELNYEETTSYLVTVSAADSYGSAGMVMLTIGISDVDEPPEITLASAAGVDVTVDGNAVSVDENHAGDLVEVTATDPETTHTDYTLVLAGTHSTSFTLNTGVLSFTNPPDHEAREVYRLTLTASNASESSTLNVTVTVRDVNDPPIITGEAEVSLNEVVDPTPGQVVRVDTYTKSDPDRRPPQTTNWGPVGSSQVLSGADRDTFEFDLPTGALTFKRPPDYENGGGRYRVTLTANDGTDPGTLDVTVNVANVEEAGTLALGAQRGVNGEALVATLTDPDNVVSETWQWQRSASGTSGWTDIANADSNSYTSGADDVGNYLRASVTYTDGTGPDETTLTADTEFPTDNDASSNQPPTPPDPLPEVADVPEDAPAGRNVVQVVFTDPEGEQQLRYTLISDEFAIGSGSGRITVKSGELNYEETTSYSVTVSAADSYGSAGMVMLTIGISNVNEAPTAADFVVTVPEDETVDIDVVEMASDEDAGDTLTVARVERHPEAGTAVVDDGTNDITYEPNDNYHGADSFTYQVKDGAGLSSNIATVAITIDPVNDAPTFIESMPARRVSESAEAGTLVGATVAAEDVEGDTLTYSLSGEDASSFEIDSEGQITVATGVTFDIGTQETYTFTVEADDGFERATVEVTITLMAAPVRPPPVGGGGGGGGGPTGPTPSQADFEWSVSRDIEALDSGHDKPSGTWSDGATLWVLENGAGADDAIYAYDLETGERVEGREFKLDETNRAPRGVWSDRTVLWVSDSGRNRLFAHNLASGERLPERDIALAERNRAARGIWSDEETMFALDGGKDSLFAYDLASGELLAEYALDPTNDDPHGIWSDRVTVWVSNDDPKRLFAYRLPVLPDQEADSGDEDSDDGARELERVSDEEFGELSDASNNSPRGIWSDGDVMYVADESDGKVYSYNMPDAIDARLASLTLSGVDIGEFSPNHEEYEGAAGEGVTETTVEAAAMQRRASVGIDPPDIDEAAEGRQVALAGTGEITVTVTSADGSRKKTYRVRLGGPEDEASSDPTSRCFRGDVVEGFSLVVYEGGSLEDLVVCARSSHVVALYVLDNGVYVPSIVDAPDFVNRSFRELYAEGIPPLTPLIAGSNGPASPYTGSDGTSDGDAPQSWPACLRGEVVEGFSLVIYEGGGVDDLVACARSLDVSALYTLNEGQFVSYMLGASDFVNQPFRDLYPRGLPPSAPLVAKSDGPPEVN